MSKSFAEELADALEEYSDEVTEALGAAVNTVAKNVNKVIKEHIPFKQRTGEYVKAFRVTDTSESPTERKKNWHVEKPHYRLTHLLEKSHLTRDGVTRTRAYPHIKYGEEYARANLEKEFEKELDK